MQIENAKNYKCLYLEAAYGCSYATAEAAVCAWKDGKDFKIIGSRGTYCSIRDSKLMKKEYPGGIFIEYDKWFRVIRVL